MNFMIVPELLVCSSFLISVCMFIVLKALLVSSVIVIDCSHRGGGICFKLLTTVLFVVVVSSL